jgi:hypothetical protein
VEGDDASAAWPRDGSELLVYGGSSGYLLHAMSGAVQTLSYLVGYGSVAWLSTLRAPPAKPLVGPMPDDVSIRLENSKPGYRPDGSLNAHNFSILQHAGYDRG